MVREAFPQGFFQPYLENMGDTACECQNHLCQTEEA